MESQECLPGAPSSFRFLPIYLALVDVTGSEEDLELVKAGLMAAMEALPSFALFGMLLVSDSVGMVDMRSQSPAVKRIRVPAGEDGDIALGLEEVMALPDFLVSVTLKRNNIANAIEGLSALLPPPPEDDLPASKRKPVKRAFGPAVAAIVDYLTVYEGFASARLLTFLHGIPNHGVGSLDSSRIKTLAGDENSAELLAPSSHYYRALAGRAAEIGLCIDMYIISNMYCDLASIKFLTTRTGGKMRLYEAAVNATLPQDLFRQLTKPQAAQAVLRVRTSAEFQPAAYYGNMLADPAYDNLQHVVGCDEHSSFAVDFEYTSGNGLPAERSRTSAGPVVQMAFAYTTVIEGPPPADADEPHPMHAIVQRRLRIVTREAHVADSVRKMYNEAQPDIIMTVLTHKIIRASLDDGVREGRLLLQDWLSILAACYNKNRETTRKDISGVGGVNVDLTFADYSALMYIPRYVYALLQHNLMSSENVHPDERIYLQCFLSSLQPHFLLTCLYPRLMAFADENTVSDEVLVLANATVQSSASSIFLLDNFTGIHVYYRDGQNGPQFPPAPNALIRSMVNELKQGRHVTPQVTYSAAGQSDARHFLGCLIEDQEGPSMTYFQFLEAITQAVKTIAA